MPCGALFWYRWILRASWNTVFRQFTRHRIRRRTLMHENTIALAQRRRHGLGQRVRYFIGRVIATCFALSIELKHRMRGSNNALNAIDKGTYRTGLRDASTRQIIC